MKLRIGNETHFCNLAKNSIKGRGVSRQNKNYENTLSSSNGLCNYELNLYFLYFTSLTSEYNFLLTFGINERIFNTIITSTHRGRRGGLMVISDRTVRARALAGDIVLWSWARQFTLIVLLSTQMYK